MRRLYQALLHLYPSRYRERFGDEMLGVFAVAEGRALQQGLVPYFSFCARETAGLLSGALSQRFTDWRFSMKSRYWILASGVAGLAIGAAASFLIPTAYISTAVIRVVPSIGGAPEGPGRNMWLAELIASTRDQVLSRRVLTKMIETHDLYRKERGQIPMEDVIEKMRKNIMIDMGGLRLSGPNSLTAFTIAFRYDNRFLAQRVTRDLMTQFMDTNIREGGQQFKLTAAFLKEQVEAAAAQWARSIEAVQKARAGTPEYERLVFDRELARRRYEQVRTREFEGSQIPRGMLEVLDLPNLPESPTEPNRRFMTFLGFVAGCLIGGFVTFVRSYRARRLLPREV